MVERYTIIAHKIWKVLTSKRAGLIGTYTILGLVVAFAVGYVCTFTRSLSSDPMRAYDAVSALRSLAPMSVPTASVHGEIESDMSGKDILSELEKRRIEEEEIYPKLRDLTGDMFRESINAYDHASGYDDLQTFQRLIAYFGVPHVLFQIQDLNAQVDIDEEGEYVLPEEVAILVEGLRDEVPEAAYKKIVKELVLVIEGIQETESPLFKKYLKDASLLTTENYVQYVPVGYYAEEQYMHAYWMVMNWYKQKKFPIDSSQLTSDVLHIVLMLDQLGSMEDWKDVYALVEEIDGPNASWSVYEYHRALTENKNVPLGFPLVMRVQSALFPDRTSLDVYIAVRANEEMTKEEAKQVKEERRRGAEGFRFMPLAAQVQNPV